LQRFRPDRQQRDGFHDFENHTLLYIPVKFGDDVKAYHVFLGKIEQLGYFFAVRPGYRAVDLVDIIVFHEIFDLVDGPEVVGEDVFQYGIIVEKTDNIESVRQVGFDDVVQFHAVFPGAHDYNVFGVIPFPAVRFHKDADQYAPQRENQQYGQIVHNEESSQIISHIEENKAGRKQKDIGGGKRKGTLHNLVEKNDRHVQFHRHKIDGEKVAEVKQ
jgi:hypothetical protein